MSHNAIVDYGNPRAQQAYRGEPLFRLGYAFYRISIGTMDFYECRCG